MIRIEHRRHDDVIVVRASGTLTTADYETAVPRLEHLMERATGPLRILMRLEDFKGWEIGALWSELEFDLKHRGDFGRIAIIGDTALEQWGTTLAAPFIKADVRFFTPDKELEAREWLDVGVQDDAT
ncbi:STAS/SEC14 domain-containing protein [Yoonia sp.]|uniref:STAS/SEC14 domain-containing protein n=1 Tax=Yoonia sp. TaxID=2212373 RepID=UPI0025F88B74|nr:STAS/SEC14 domain-containing protein [Yoonia sp.]